VLHFISKSSSQASLSGNGAGSMIRFSSTQEGDYVVFISFEPAYVKTQLADCAEFTEHIRRLIWPNPE
jgi:hypothetical protein